MASPLIGASRTGAFSVCAAGTASGQTAVVDGQIFTPEMFGAKGDGRTNDTAAFQALGKAVSGAGGGTIRLRAVTYLVGEQQAMPKALDGYIFSPAQILEIQGCSNPLRIVGNGARLRCMAALRYGVFSEDGARLDRPMPNLTAGNWGVPYEQMILVDRCSGGVEITGLELDGNSGAAIIGGRYGDIGWQLPAIGLLLQDNAGAEVIRDVHSHHHLLDGILVRNRSRATATTRLFDRVRCEYNGRQGLSFTAGTGYRFVRCIFAHTGRGKVTSAPGAGVDMEAEAGPISNLMFEDCRFVDNFGAGMVADSGDTVAATFTRCDFIGTTNCAAWPNKPRFVFTRCRFVGQILACYSSGDTALAARFVRCSFTDDPALSPTGKVFAAGPIADLSNGTNVRFDSCTFTVSHGAALPWSWKAIYVNCTMRQTGGPQGYPRGTWIGHSTIVGNVDLYSSTIAGSVTINGVRHV